MDELEHSQEPILKWINEVMIKLLGRCTTNVNIYKNGSISISVSNDTYLSTWTIWNWYSEDKVSAVEREIEVELGISI